MIPAYRLATMALLTCSVLGACRRKPQLRTDTTIRSRTDTISRTTFSADSSARMRAREDSIRRANEAAARREADRRALETHRNALLAKVYFEFDSDDLSAQGRSTLDAKVAAMQALPNIRIRVVGHCDSRGSDEYNLALGQRRALTAKRYLTDRGIEPSRIDVRSMGEEMPEVEGENESAWAQNRRDEFEITSGGDAVGVPR